MSTCRMRRRRGALSCPVAPKPPASPAAGSAALLPGRRAEPAARCPAPGGRRGLIEHVGRRDVQHLNAHLVVRPGVVGVDHAHAVGHHQSPLERRAASGENTKEVSRRHLDDQARRDERNLAAARRSLRRDADRSNPAASAVAYAGGELWDRAVSIRSCIGSAYSRGDACAGCLPRSSSRSPCRCQLRRRISRRRCRSIRASRTGTLPNGLSLLHPPQPTARQPRAAAPGRPGRVERRGRRSARARAHARAHGVQRQRHASSPASW